MSIDQKKKYDAIIWLLILIAIGGIVLYGRSKADKNEPPKNFTPHVIGPTTPPPAVSPNNETSR